MNYRFLYEYARDYGHDPEDWPEDIQRNAAIALYRADGFEKYPAWLNDALTDMVMNPAQRTALLAYMAEPLTLDMLTGIGSVVERSLRKYPMDWIRREIDENFYVWRCEAVRGDTYDRLHEERQARELEAL